MSHPRRRWGRGAAGVFVVLATPCRAESASDAGTRGVDSESTLVSRVANDRGFAFFPSTPPAGALRFALGGSYDAIDPQVMYGVSVRFPQLTLDAIGALGRGFSLKGHFNSMLVTTELLLGGGYAWQALPWAFELSASAGLYVGRLDAFGFDAWLYAFWVLFPDSPALYSYPRVVAGYEY